ncbi:hypothetical protein [Anaerocolumna chitinilytica]|uniref:Cyclic lactone autoinducer peptide n=1 Tax=Anaerocolumna chitinilytica TaxID=1727145 RepID=A0A7I8DNR0_9FIRM|nr:hypothetical protein [Anaerocolumna chitinilytica]BCK00044.1 hypothetical protein bsdcttw_30840 [Anaerocolumna chitinilytica]
MSPIKNALTIILIIVTLNLVIFNAPLNPAATTDNGFHILNDMPEKD